MYIYIYEPALYSHESRWPSRVDQPVGRVIFLDRLKEAPPYHGSCVTTALAVVDCDAMEAFGLRVSPVYTGPVGTLHGPLRTLVMLLPIHIVAGGLAIILGGVALVAAKGGWLHRRIGLLFVYAMLTMGFSGSILAILKSWTNANVLGGFMSAYFVVTGLTTVRPVSVWTRRLNAMALVLAIALCLVEIGLGFKAFGSPGGAIDGAPFFMMFIMATVVGLAAAGDVRLMRSGILRGAPRLARHLWRMCFALFIAAGSFFSIRQRVAKILPEPFTTPTMRALPIVLIFLAMFFWLCRVRGRRMLPHAQ